MKRRDILKLAGTGAAVGALTAAGTTAAVAADSTLNAVWVHGTSAAAEDLNALKNVQRVGWGTNFSGKPGAETWFHFSIPTPVIIDDVRPTLEKVFVFYRTDGASVRNIHIYDGPQKIRAFDNLMWKGDFGNIGPATSWVLNPAPTIAFGLGISIGVVFSIGFDSAVTTDILFTTAGADFRLKKPASQFLQPTDKIDRQRLTIPH